MNTLITHHSQFERAGPNSTYPAPVGSSFFCATCWRIFPLDPKSPGARGYGIDAGGGMHCYSCCHLRDISQLKDRTKPFGAYLSSDGKTVSTWPGDALGTVHSHGVARNGWHGSEIHRFHVQDAHGAWWQAWGPGKGMYCTLRAIKTPSYAKHWGQK